MKKVYIVLTYTGTFLSKIVKFYTRKEFSHVSISLDENLDKMYSFGRLNAYVPFIGGFVKESPKYGTFKRFHNTICKIYSLEVTDQEYKKLEKLIDDIKNDREDYRFNIIGLFAVPLRVKVKRHKCFYCAEFVKYLFVNSDIDVNLPNIIKPDDFSKIDGTKEVYSGFLKKYKV